MSPVARRDVVGSLASLPLAAVLAEPRLARAAASELREVSLTTPIGRKVKAAVAVPEERPVPAVLLVHEWWGLNDQIKSVAAALAKQGYLALAVDLYDGKVATAPDDARALMGAVNPGAASETLVAWIAWLRRHPRATGRVATVGWCFGGGWSLAASLAAPVEGTIVYYGRVNRTAEELSALKGPVLGHFASRDKWINKEMVEGFEAAMAQAGKAYDVHWYEADHAFANPTSARYDEADAALSWERTLAFLEATLKQ